MTAMTARSDFSYNKPAYIRNTFTKHTVGAQPVCAPKPVKEDADEQLRKLCLSGIASRYTGEQKRRALVRREEELDAVRQQGSAAEYLRMVKALRATKAKPEEFCLRGTIGSSLIAYVLGLSDIDPLKDSPKLYPEFFFGIDGHQKPSFQMVVTPQLLERLWDYSDAFRTTGLSVFEDDEAFVQNFLDDPIVLECAPKNFSEFVKCYGLIHSTGAWTGNADELLRGGVVAFSELIATREDVFEFLVNHGVSKADAFDIAEDVRKGKVSHLGWKAEQLRAMDRAGIPEWFRASCEKIGYLCPRAHAMVMLKRYLTE